ARVRGSTSIGDAGCVHAHPLSMRRAPGPRTNVAVVDLFKDLGNLGVGLGGGPFDRLHAVGIRAPPLLFMLTLLLQELPVVLAVTRFVLGPEFGSSVVETLSLDHSLDRPGLALLRPSFPLHRMALVPLVVVVEQVRDHPAQDADA